MSDRYSAGDVFRAPDPYTDESGGPRPWLVLVADALPFAGEEYLCAGLTLSDLPDNLAVGDDWVAGDNPDRTSFCSPWVLATVKHDVVAHPQGTVTSEFTERGVGRSVEYLRGDVGVSG